MTRDSSDDKKETAKLVNEVRERVASRVDELRRREVSTLKFLEDSAEIPRGTLSRLLAAKLNVSLDTLVRLAYAIGVDVSEIFRPGPNRKPEIRVGRPKTKRTGSRGKT